MCSDDEIVGKEREGQILLSELSEYEPQQVPTSSNYKKIFDAHKKKALVNKKKTAKDLQKIVRRKRGM